MSFYWLLSAAVGFLSLSQEILWVRYANFAYYSLPPVFGYVLMLFLLGIAAGALIGKRICASIENLNQAMALVLIAAGVVDLVSPFALVPMQLDSPVLLVLALLIFVCAMMKGIIFPIVHHLGSAGRISGVGGSVSRVYFFNIVGSTMGPLVTGYVLLDIFGLQKAMLTMGGLTVALGLLCNVKARSWATAVFGIAGLAAAVSAFTLPEMLISTLSGESQTALRRVIENRSGIVHVVSNPNFLQNGDAVYGANVYDGRASVDPRHNGNAIHRVHVLAALQPQARDILVVGVSAGAWTRILSTFPEMRQIDAVEINPGYLDLIADYPQIRPILSDPRIRIEIDDGRRWLRRNPTRSYDLIVMNTSFYWRNSITNLLSRENLELLRGHLRPGGILAYNATGSIDAFKTATAVFPFAFRYDNFIYASDQDFRQRMQGAEAIFLRMRTNGRPTFDAGNAADQAFLRHMLELPFVSIEEDEKKKGRKGEIVTDWNMITEYRHGMAWP